MSNTDRKPFVSCNYTPAMSGHFATLWGWTEAEDGHGFWEPYETGIGRYATLDEAEAEGRFWAEEIGVEFRPVDREAAAAAAERSKLRAVFVKQLRDEGLSFAEAHRKGLEKFPF